MGRWAMLCIFSISLHSHDCRTIYIHVFCLRNLSTSRNYPRSRISQNSRCCLLSYIRRDKVYIMCYSWLSFRKWWNVFIADHQFNHQHQSLSSSAKISVDHQHNQNLTKRRLALQWAPVALYSENIAAVKSLACQTFETRKFEVVFWPFYRTYGYVWFQYCSAIL